MRRPLPLTRWHGWNAQVDSKINLSRATGWPLKWTENSAPGCSSPPSLKTWPSLHTLGCTGTDFFPRFSTFFPRFIPLLFTCCLKLRCTDHIQIYRNPFSQNLSLLFTCWMEDAHLRWIDSHPLYLLANTADKEWKLSSCFSQPLKQWNMV